MHVNSTQGLSCIRLCALCASTPFGRPVTPIVHILDIEPLVITNVKVSGSKEQFMTTDGTNIPLFVTADIQFAMWMLPDPNKGFVRWLGDDVFNIGYTNAQSTSAPATGNTRPAGKPTDSKPLASGKRAAVPGAGSAASNPKLKK